MAATAITPGMVDSVREGLVEAGRISLSRLGDLLRREGMPEANIRLLLVESEKALAGRSRGCCVESKSFASWFETPIGNM